MRMRVVRVDTDADVALDDARAGWARVDDAWEMIEWVLMRDPTVGEPLTESGTSRTFVFAGSITHEMPDIQVVYIFDENYITIKSVRFGAPSYSAGTA